MGCNSSTAVQAEAADLLFLPFEVKVSLVLQKQGDAYILDNSQLKSSSTGLCYRSSKDIEDKDSRGRGPVWGEAVEGTAVESEDGKKWLWIQSRAQAAHTASDVPSAKGTLLAPIIDEHATAKAEVVTVEDAPISTITKTTAQPAVPEVGAQTVQLVPEAQDIAFAPSKDASVAPQLAVEPAAAKRREKYAEIILSAAMGPGGPTSSSAASPRQPAETVELEHPQSHVDLMDGLVRKEQADRARAVVIPELPATDNAAPVKVCGFVC